MAPSAASSFARTHPPAKRPAPPLRLAESDAAPVQPAAMPRTGLLLVGTRHSIAALVGQMNSLEPAPVIAGCIVVGPDGVREIAGCPVLGSPTDLPAIHARLGLRMGVVSLPSTMVDQAAALGRSFTALGIPTRQVPTLADLLDGSPTAPPSRTSRLFRPPPPLDLAALVGRQPHPLDTAAVARVLSGKRVLITGAGGSIGSELARVAAAFSPERLILMDRSENALFEIDRCLAERFPHIARRAVLHDVAEADGTLRHALDLRPQVVFHAAAHKHVPLMEDHPGHAVTNNLFGTKSIADAAISVGAERFVMISSDKAVNPQSVMGATKRMAEIYVRSLARPGLATRLSMVRFGNVLGSACSVLPIWSQQLAAGVPLTVTDPRMTRYFMTIPEAASLVIQSAAVEHDGSVAPVYVLDMGQPVRILDLAASFIRAHGLSPRLRPSSLSADALIPENGPLAEEVEIVLTGARPGEKLHEQLAYAAELLRPTEFAGINSWAGAAPEAAAFGAVSMVADMSAVRLSQDRIGVWTAIRKHIPELGANRSE